MINLTIPTIRSGVQAVFQWSLFAITDLFTVESLINSQRIPSFPEIQWTWKTSQGCVNHLKKCCPFLWNIYCHVCCAGAGTSQRALYFLEEESTIIWPRMLDGDSQATNKRECSYYLLIFCLCYSFVAMSHSWRPTGLFIYFRITFIHHDFTVKMVTKQIVKLKIIYTLWELF